jgi:hypothetical protein
LDKSLDSYLTELYELLMTCSRDQFAELHNRTFRDAAHLDATELPEGSGMKEMKLEYFSEISLYEKEELARIYNVAEQIVSREEP